MRAVEHVNRLDIVDVPAREIPLRAPHRAHTVRMAQNRALRGGHHTILVIERHRIVRVHAGFIRLHRRFNTCDRRIMHDHVDEIDWIHADVQQRAASQRRIGDTRLRRGRIAQIRVDRLHLADHAGCDDIVDHATRRHIPRPNRLRAQHAGLIRNVQYLTRLLRVRAERLLHQHALAGAHAQNRLLGMEVMRSGDIHKIHVRIGDKLLIRSVRHRKTVFRRERRCALAVAGRHRVRCDQITVPVIRRHFHQRFGHALRDTARAENRHIDLCHEISLF